MGACYQVQSVPESFLQVRSDLFKTPNSSNSFVVVLVVVVLIAIVEILVPCVVSAVLRRTPVIGIRKTANSHHKGVKLSARYLTDREVAFFLAKKTAASLTPLIRSPFIAFKLKPAHLLSP